MNENVQNVLDSVYRKEKNPVINQTEGSLFRSKEMSKILLETDIVLEDKSKRTENSKHYLLKNGTYRAEISLTDQHYLDANGDYQDIVPVLVDEADIDTKDNRFSKEVIGDKNYECMSTTKISS